MATAAAKTLSSTASVAETSKARTRIRLIRSLLRPSSRAASGVYTSSVMPGVRLRDSSRIRSVFVRRRLPPKACGRGPLLGSRAPPAAAFSARPASRAVA